MVWSYRRCNPGDCCKETTFGAPGAAAGAKGKTITPASITTCGTSTPKTAGNTCKCVYVLHYTKREDNNTVVVKEILHEGVNWTDDDEADLVKEREDLPKGHAVRRELFCIEFTAAGEPVELKEPR